MNADMVQYLTVFLDEALEQVELLESEVLKLEQGAAPPETLQTMFRAAHTVKGSSRAMGFNQIGELTHELENVLDALRHDQLTITPIIVNILLEGIDALKVLLDHVATASSDDLPLGDLIARVAIVVNAGSPTIAQPSTQFELTAFEITSLEAERESGHTVFDITIELAESCVMRAVRIMMSMGALEPLGTVFKTIPAEEDLSDEVLAVPFRVLLSTKSTASEIEAAIRQVSEIAAIRVEPFNIPMVKEEAPPTPAAVEHAPKTESQTIRVGLNRLDALLNLVGELVIDRTQIEKIVGDLQRDSDSDERFSQLKESMSRVSRITSELQDEVMKTRMLPIDGVFQRLPRMVRDLAQKTGKDIQFTVTGGETELDRSVLEVLGDPLIHLLRNSIDHGVETADLRVAHGKSPTGHVSIEARYEESHIVIEVKDDGRGIDPAKIREAAIKKGILTPAAAAQLSDRESLELIMSSGFSTAQTISEISGRGVGMDIVKTNIERIGGRIHVESRVGQGTQFRIHLPVTLAIMRALLVQSVGETLVLPLSSVHEILSLRRAQVATVGGLAVVALRGETLPLASLWGLLQNDPNATSRSTIGADSLVVVVGHGDRRIGICVDSVVGEQEVVLKSLGSLIGEIPGVTGASILGDGNVALIIDVASAIDSMRNEFQLEAKVA